MIAVATGAVGGSLGRSNAATQNSGTAPPASLQSLTPSTQTAPPSAGPASTTAPPAPAAWRIAWGSGMALGYAPTSNATLREIIPVHQAGSQVKLRLSNAYGDKPLAIGAASVAASSGVAAGLVSGTLTPLTFGGQPSVVVPVGAATMTDAVALNVQAGETLAVSLFVAQPDLVTVHPCCQGPIVSYGTVNGEGNLTAAAATAAFVFHSHWPAIVDALEVLQTGGNGSIVVVGDSITDGYHSTVRWTDVLQQRIDMLPVADQRAVVNEGITANTMTELPNDDSKKGGGEAGVTRIQRDALTQPGVSTVVLLLGINDLWFGASSAAGHRRDEAGDRRRPHGRRADLRRDAPASPDQPDRGVDAGSAGGAHAGQRLDPALRGVRRGARPRSGGGRRLQRGVRADIDVPALRLRGPPPP